MSYEVVSLCALRAVWTKASVWCAHASFQPSLFPSFPLDFSLTLFLYLHPDWWYCTRKQLTELVKNPCLRFILRWNEEKCVTLRHLYSFWTTRQIKKLIRTLESTPCKVKCKKRNGRRILVPLRVNFKIEVSQSMTVVKGGNMKWDSRAKHNHFD